MSKLDTVSFDFLIEICEGAENSAELLKTMIADNPANSFNSESDRIKSIANDWANYMSGFWDDGHDLSEEEHWKVNQKWGMALLESIVGD